MKERRMKERDGRLMLLARLVWAMRREQKQARVAKDLRVKDNVAEYEKAVDEMVGEVLF